MVLALALALLSACLLVLNVASYLTSVVLDLLE